MTELTNTLAQLVAINSVNPEWGGPGESGVASYVSDFFQQAGIECWAREVLPGRSNVYAKLSGQDSSRRIILEAHMDTVAVSSMTIDPFDPARTDGRMMGRGACDVKAGLAAMMHAVRDVHVSNSDPPCDIWLAAVVDEEHLFRGVLALIDEMSKHPVDSNVVIVAEPTECQIVTANKGVLRWTLTTRGKAAHSSKPELGHNAIADMMTVVGTLQADSHQLARRSHPLVGSPTLCISLIEGGSQINFVPDECQISLDRRLIPGETSAAVLEHYRCILSELPGIDCQMGDVLLEDEAMETTESQPVVCAAKRAARILGISPESRGVPFGCDVTKLSRAGHHGIIFGPGNIDQAHADVEFVELEQVELARRFYRTFIMECFA